MVRSKGMRGRRFAKRFSHTLLFRLHVQKNLHRKKTFIFIFRIFLSVKASYLLLSTFAGSRQERKCCCCRTNMSPSSFSRGKRKPEKAEIKKGNAGWQGLNLDFRNAVLLVHIAFSVWICPFSGIKKLMALLKWLSKLFVLPFWSFPLQPEWPPSFWKLSHFLTSISRKLQQRKSVLIRVFFLEEEREGDRKEESRKWRVLLSFSLFSSPPRSSNSVRGSDTTEEQASPNSCFLKITFFLYLVHSMSFFMVQRRTHDPKVAGSNPGSSS